MKASLIILAKELVDELKSSFAPMESDIKDAKRRISVAKGPKKKTTTAPKAENANTDDDESGHDQVDETDDEDDQ